ncbi:hypothetical protein [Streptomyces sp. NRRL S-340]|uniref:hypothetical protein n=1 Tax=Streptomyces sp. NRRL S-340 TaxID=1463901 RepID=UPI00068FB442|nr:hypothetical protein [Streptomyces sp. NRRL S-340]
MAAAVVLQLRRGELDSSVAVGAQSEPADSGARVGLQERAGGEPHLVALLEGAHDGARVVVARGLGDHDADDVGAVPAVLRPGLEHADGAVAQAVLVDLDADGGGGAEGLGQAQRLLDLLQDPGGDLDLVIVLAAAGVVAVLDRVATGRS